MRHPPPPRAGPIEDTRLPLPDATTRSTRTPGRLRLARTRPATGRRSPTATPPPDPAQPRHPHRLTPRGGGPSAPPLQAQRATAPAAAARATRSCAPMRTRARRLPLFCAHSSLPALSLLTHVGNIPRVRRTSASGGLASDSGATTAGDHFGMGDVPMLSVRRLVFAGALLAVVPFAAVGQDKKAAAEGRCLRRPPARPGTVPLAPAADARRPPSPCGPVPAVRRSLSPAVCPGDPEGLQDGPDPVSGDPDGDEAGPTGRNATPPTGPRRCRRRSVSR